MLDIIKSMYGNVYKIITDYPHKKQARILAKEIIKNRLALINVGSGDWECPGWQCLDYPSEWYSKAQKRHCVIPYDIRNDNIPFGDNSVDGIYCSHVIEHIENSHILRFFNEAYRSLKVGGVLRICCPDAEFLYNVSKNANQSYWEWRESWFRSKYWNSNNTVRPIDFLIREVATPKLDGYVNAICRKDFSKEFESSSMVDFLEMLTNDLTFRNEFVGDHINYWTFDKMKKMLQTAGFFTIIRSKWNGSICRYMKNKGYFDKTHPQMSLYVEAVK